MLSALPACIHVHVGLVPKQVRGGHQIPEKRLADSCKRWELITGPLEERRVLLITEHPPAPVVETSEESHYSAGSV